MVCLEVGNCEVVLEGSSVVRVEEEADRVEVLSVAGYLGEEPVISSGTHTDESRRCRTVAELY